MTAKSENLSGGDIILYVGSAFFGAFGLWGASGAARNLIRGRKDTPAPKP